MMRFADIDQCPVPEALAAEVLELKRLTGAELVSCYRGDDPAAIRILRKHGKQNQAQLYDGWTHRRPGYNPANPPGRSTHELRSDGVAYPGPVGRRLRYFEVGMDWTHSERVLVAATKRGWVVVRPYSDGREYHHLNFRKEPILKRLRLVKTLHRGDRGVRVYRSVERLIRLGYLREPVGESHWRFGPKVETAVETFQKAHGIPDTGMIGATTYASLRAADRAKAAKAKPRPLPADRAVAPSRKAAEFIAAFEGGQNPKDHLFHPYRDPVGVWTIGYGHTEGVTKGSRPLTQQQAEEILLRDLREKYGPGVERATRRAGVKLNQNQFDALTSFVYNLGVGILGPDHTIGQSLRRKNLKQVADDMLLYNKAGSPPKALAGLTRRREAERSLFLR